MDRHEIQEYKEALDYFLLQLHKVVVEYNKNK